MTGEDEAATIAVVSPDFPFQDVQTIVARIREAGTTVPGFIPPKVGFLSLDALLYASCVEGAKTVILPDRNIVSRMARVAREGAVHPVDTTTQAAIDLMALAQAMNFDIEPSVAFHELAHRDGNQIANEELRWFRAANHGQADAWISLALGRTSQLATVKLGAPTDIDLAAPLNRYRRNYAVALRIASLELDAEKSPLDRAKTLLEWMVSDFIVAGPAAVFAAMFLSPRASRGGLIKQLRSPDRARALAGVRNAAWDITHLSDFARLSMAADHAKKRFIFATADRALAQLGHLLFTGTDSFEGLERQLAADIVPWWGKGATEVASRVVSAARLVGTRPPPKGPPDTDDYVGQHIGLGERAVLAWRQR